MSANLPKLKNDTHLTNAVLSESDKLQFVEARLR